MSATARGVRVLVPLLLIASALALALPDRSSAAFGATPSYRTSYSSDPAIHIRGSNFVNALGHLSSSIVAAQSLDHMQGYVDEMGDGSTLDFDTLVIGIDDQYDLLGFIMSFYSPFYGLAPGESVMVLVDNDKNPATGFSLGGLGVEYKIALDYSPVYGYDAYFMDFGRPVGGTYYAVPIDFSVDLMKRMILFAVPESYVPNHHGFRFVVVAVNASITYDALPDFLPGYGYLQYDDPGVMPTTTTLPPTTTTLPPTTTTTVPPTTTTTVPPTATTTTLPTTTFVDVPSWHQYAFQINDIASRGMVEGYGNGRFGPEDWVKRQQFAKMIVLGMGYPVSEVDVCSFSDVDKPSNNLYPDNYVAVAAARGITLGVAPGHFAPWNDISRAQMITMVARAAGVGEPPATYSPPFGNFSDTHYPWARRAAFAGLLSGLQGMGSEYDFWAPATRGEVCVVLYNLVNR